MIYVREDIPNKELTRHTFKDNIEGIFVELNFRKYKILVLGTYRPPNSDKIISITSQTPWIYICQNMKNLYFSVILM